jgi:zinc protease
MLLDRYRAVTRQDIQRVARKYLHPDQLTLLVVGDVRESDASWRDWGHITALTLDDPSAASTAAGTE